MKIPVRAENLSNICDYLTKEKVLSVDTETTGLHAYKGDRAFALIIATAREAFYFNLHNCEIPALPMEELRRALAPIFLDESKTLFFHNAKFDMAMIAKTIGLPIRGRILDLWTLDRLHDNEHMSYELSEVAKRHGFEKSEAVEEYIKKHRLYDETKNKRFDKVPYNIMFDYACRDARITFDAGLAILSKLDKFFHEKSWPSVTRVCAQESVLTPVLFDMEAVGVKCDAKFIEQGIIYYTQLIQDKEREFEHVTGKPYVKGANTFKEVFAGEKWAMTDKGNPKFDAKAMKGFSHPAAKIVVEVSEAKKQLDYFSNFYKLMDGEDVIHTNLCQAGTATGRLSSRNPNLQNLTKPEKYSKGVVDTYAVRKAFVPRDGFFFAALDYEQIEYRVMLDMARAFGLIERVKGGLDVHEATAQVAGITRQQAKTVNFLTLYGGGIKKLAEGLSCSENDARRIQQSIFDSAPEIKSFIRTVIGTAERRGYIFNQWGRRYWFKDSRFAYKAPNYLVQGTCADILKAAMIACHKFLHENKLQSRMILTIHDELIFEIADDEAHIVPVLAEIMTSSYEHRYLPLLVDIEWSRKNLAEKQPWTTFNEKTRDEVQRSLS